MDEFDIIRRYFAEGYPARDDVVLGIGDDGALMQPPAGEVLVSVTDTLISGTHFPAGMAADAVAHRALAVNLSDLASMGAMPRWFLLALALPEADAQWLGSFADGLRRLAAEFGIALVGGDTVRGPLAVTITALGSVPPADSLRRDGARPGDGIYVTGHCGEAAWAWQTIARGAWPAVSDPLYRRFAYPEPRVRAGQDLRGIASAMIDVSDGLHVDLGRLLGASGAGGVGDVQALPLSPELLERNGEASARDLLLGGGDDYELCFTVPAARAAALEARARDWDFPLTRIGIVVSEPGLRWQLDGKEFMPPPTAFEHF